MLQKRECLIDFLLWLQQECSIELCVPNRTGQAWVRDWLPAEERVDAYLAASAASDPPREREALLGELGE